MKILFSNIGYAKGIDGTLWQHVCRATRHLYCPAPVQMTVLGQINAIIQTQKPDYACFVELDQGSLHSAYLNQIQHIITDDYPFYDIANKYGADNWRTYMPMLGGRSNGFIARQTPAYKRLYFENGTKRLIYQITLPNSITLLFTHFSLSKNIRAKQFAEVRKLMAACHGPVILMADFNILHGFDELAPLLSDTDLVVLNDEQKHTFRFHTQFKTLDLCLCSKSIAHLMTLDIIDQPYSDHDALMLSMHTD